MKKQLSSLAEKAMFKKKDKTKARTVDNFSQLQIDDLISLKLRSELPEIIQGETLTVSKVQTYQYRDGMVPDFCLDHSSGLKLNAVYDDESDEITFSLKLKHPNILTLFDSAELASIWDEEHHPAILNTVLDDQDDIVISWMSESYSRRLCGQFAYFYETDQRDQEIDKFEDDSMQFMYHELDGSDANKSITIEIWEDGETEFFAEITTPADVIESYWANG